jgi:hypothetical protein
LFIEDRLDACEIAFSTRFFHARETKRVRQDHTSPPALRKIMLCIFHGLALSVGQSVEHPLRRSPANPSVRSQVPHRVSSLLEFVQDLGDEGLPTLGGRLSFSLFARDIDPEFQRFGHPQFHMLALVRAIESLGQISVLRIGRPRHTSRVAMAPSIPEASFRANSSDFPFYDAVQATFSSPTHAEFML